MVKSLEIPDIINKFSRKVEKDLKNEYNSDIIVINMLNKSTSKSI